MVQEYRPYCSRTPQDTATFRDKQLQSGAILGTWLCHVCSPARGAQRWIIQQVAESGIWNRLPPEAESSRSKSFPPYVRYRLRDILLLLNQAFYNAAKQGRNQIVLADIDATAKNISTGRLTDLHREYESILPGLSQLTMAFSGHNPELTIKEATAIIDRVVTREDYSPRRPRWKR